MSLTDLAILGGPFGSVFDVGGNIGEWAEAARAAWPDARLTSFEPVHDLARVHRERSAGRWWVEEVAISRERGQAMILRCENQHTASTMQRPGGAREHHFQIRDRFTPQEVKTRPLDDYLPHVWGRLLVKIDVEGHEGEVLAGAPGVLEVASTVVVEVQNDPNIFLGSPSAHEIDETLRSHGLRFAGITAALTVNATGEVLQFDGVWRRAAEITEEQPEHPAPSASA